MAAVRRIAVFPVTRSIEAAMLNAALLCLLLAAGMDPGRLVHWRDATAAEVRQHQSDVLAECMDLYRETGRQC